MENSKTTWLVPWTANIDIFDKSTDILIQVYWIQTLNALEFLLTGRFSFMLFFL